MSEVLPLYAGADEVYEFKVKDANGVPVPNDIDVEMRVDGIGTFAAEPTAVVGTRGVTVDASRSVEFGDGVWQYQVVVLLDDPSVAAEGQIISSRLIPAEVDA